MIPGVVRTKKVEQMLLSQAIDIDVRVRRLAAFRRPQDSKVQGVKRMQLMFERILNADFQPIPFVSYTTQPCCMCCLNER